MFVYKGPMLRHLNREELELIRVVHDIGFKYII